MRLADFPLTPYLAARAFELAPGPAGAVRQDAPS